MFKISHVVVYLLLLGLISGCTGSIMSGSIVLTIINLLGLCILAIGCNEIKVNAFNQTDLPEEIDEVDEVEEVETQAVTINIPTLFMASNLNHSTNDSTDYIVDLSTDVNFDDSGLTINHMLFENFDAFASWNYRIESNYVTPSSASREFIVVKNIQEYIHHPWGTNQSTHGLDIKLHGGNDVLYFSGGLLDINGAPVGWSDYTAYDVIIELGDGNDVFIPSELIVTHIDFGAGSDVLVLRRLENTSEFSLMKGEDKIALSNGLEYSELTFEDYGGGARILAPVTLGSASRYVIARVPYQNGFTSLASVQAKSNFVQGYNIVDTEEVVTQPITINIPTLFMGTNLSATESEDPDLDGYNDYIVDLSAHPGFNNSGTASNNVLFEDYSKSWYERIESNFNSQISNSREFLVVKNLKESILAGLPPVYWPERLSHQLDIRLYGGSDVLYFTGGLLNISNNPIGWTSYSNYDVNINLGNGNDVFIPSQLIVTSVNFGAGHDVLVLTRLENTSEFSLVKGEDKIALSNGLEYSELTFEDYGTGARILAPDTLGSPTRIVIARIPYQNGFVSLADVQAKYNFVQGYTVNE